MPELPTQLPCRRLVCVLRKLGYTAQKGKSGSARSFVNSSRNPHVVLLWEPHPGRSLLSRLSWNWRKRSSVKITERTYEEGTEAFHTRRKSSHLEAASCGQSTRLGAV